MLLLLLLLVQLKRSIGRPLSPLIDVGYLIDSMNVRGSLRIIIIATYLIYFFLLYFLKITCIKFVFYCFVCTYTYLLLLFRLGCCSWQWSYHYHCYLFYLIDFLNYRYYIYIYIVSFHLYVYLFIIAISSVIDAGYLIDSMNGHIIIIAIYLIYFTTRPIFIFYYYICTCFYLLLVFGFWLMLAIWSDCCWWQRSERHLPEGVPGGRGLVAVEFVSGFTETDDTRRTMGNECRCKPKGWNDQVRRNATSPPSVSLVTDIRATDNK